MDTMRCYGWLQRFADGAGDGGSEGGNSTAPDAAAAQQRQQTQTQEQAQPQGGEQTEAKKATFDELLKDPEFKREYDKRVANSVTKRFKATNKVMNDVNAVMTSLGRRYGIDAADPKNYEAISAAYLNDDYVLEYEAERAGMSVEQYRKDREKDARIAQLERQQQEAEQERLWAAKLAEAETVRQKYPEFDLNKELADEKFKQILFVMDSVGFSNSLEGAYKVMHLDELNQRDANAAAQAAVEETKAKIGEAIRSGQQRPAEGGNKGGQAKPLSAKGMSRAQIEEIRERVARGERITFS